VICRGDAFLFSIWIATYSNNTATIATIATIGSVSFQSSAKVSLKVSVVSSFASFSDLRLRRVIFEISAWNLRCVESVLNYITNHYNIADCRLLQILQYNGTASGACFSSLSCPGCWANRRSLLWRRSSRRSRPSVPNFPSFVRSQRDTGIGNNDAAVNAYYIILLYYMYNICNMYINVLHISRISIPCSSCKKLAETSAGNPQLAPRFQESMAVLKPGISRTETQKYRK